MAKHKPAEDTGELEEQTFLALLRAAEALDDQLAEVLRDHDLSTVQYHVLRLLRSAGPHGLNCGDIRDGLVTRTADLTRLLDRLVRAGLVFRGRSAADRRQVQVRISDAGLGLLAGLDGSVAAFHHQVLGALGSRRLRRLGRYLRRLTDASA